ncbi:unnamed protein product, partial [Mesorhabditis belari]|uniref:Uncharacterized protein n=1 Tax=Mesorhabditis belari TaxID=2138241 RepID=A0AAF3EGZ1_9BILA
MPSRRRVKPEKETIEDDENEYNLHDEFEGDQVKEGIHEDLLKLINEAQVNGYGDGEESGLLVDSPDSMPGTSNSQNGLNYDAPFFSPDDLPVNFFNSTTLPPPPSYSATTYLNKFHQNDFSLVKMGPLRQVMWNTSDLRSLRLATFAIVSALQDKIDVLEFENEELRKRQRLSDERVADVEKEVDEIRSLLDMKKRKKPKMAEKAQTQASAANVDAVLDQWDLILNPLPKPVKDCWIFAQDPLRPINLAFCARKAIPSIMPTTFTNATTLKHQIKAFSKMAAKMLVPSDVHRVTCDSRERDQQSIVLSDQFLDHFGDFSAKFFRPKKAVYAKDESVLAKRLRDSFVLNIRETRRNRIGGWGYSDEEYQTEIDRNKLHFGEDVFPDEINNPYFVL